MRQARVLLPARLPCQFHPVPYTVGKRVVTPRGAILALISNLGVACLGHRSTRPPAGVRAGCGRKTKSIVHCAAAPGPASESGRGARDD